MAGLRMASWFESSNTEAKETEASEGIRMNKPPAHPAEAKSYLNKDAEGASQSELKASVPFGLPTPNPSIERDVQGLAPSAAPHVKR
jgi:hypothetical protein